jgi:Secretion system C-terminal sorting domain
MKKTISLFLMLNFFLGFSQSKSTNPMNFAPGLSAELVLNNTNTTATLTLTGPSNRWIAFKLGSFTTAMSSAPDGVFYDGTNLVDGNGGQLNADAGGAAANNWTVISNTLNSPTLGSRTIVATRAFNTGDASDYVINFADATIDVAAAFGPTDNSYVREYHGSNREKFIDRSLTTLGLEDFSLNASSVFPNPTKGDFTVTTKTALSEINVYSHTGAFVKKIKTNNETTANVKVDGLQTGVYLLELKNDTDKSWKKIVVE